MTVRATVYYAQILVCGNIGLLIAVANASNRI